MILDRPCRDERHRRTLRNGPPFNAGAAVHQKWKSSPALDSRALNSDPSDLVASSRAAGPIMLWWVNFGLVPCRASRRFNICILIMIPFAFSGDPGSMHGSATRSRGGHDGGCVQAVWVSGP
jgi:hypothetical protein